MGRHESTIRFDGYEFLPATGELWRDGERVGLQPQPGALLAALLRTPGRVVRREELKAVLWPDRIVEYDQALNFAVARLRRTLGDDAADPRWIETVPHVGYRFIGRIERNGGVPEGRDPEEDVPRREPRGRPPRRVAPAALGALALTGLTVAVVALAGDGRLDPSPARIAVLPFEWIGDPGEDLAAEVHGRAVTRALHEDLITELAHLDRGRLAVIAPESSRRAGAEARQGERMDSLLRALDIDWVLSGSVEAVSAGEVRVRSRLISVEGGRVVWSDRFVREPDEVFTLRSAIGDRVSRALGVTALARRDGSRDGDLPPLAGRALRVARYLIAEDDPERVPMAHERLVEAVGVAPDAPAVHAALAEWHARRGAWDSARVHGERAVALDERDPRGHRQLARALLELWDVAGAGRHYRRAVDLAPGIAMYRAILPAYLGVVGRYEAAIHHLEEAVRLDPLAPAVYRDLGETLVLFGAPERAVDVCRRQAELEPGSASAIACLYRAFSVAGRVDSAAAYAIDLMAAEGGGEADIRRTRGAGSGRRILVAYRRWNAERLDSLQGEGRVHPYFVARARALVGDREGAFRHLGAALDAGAIWPLYADAEPWFEPLRDDPRFAAFLAEVKRRVARAEGR